MRKEREEEVREGGGGSKEGRKERRITVCFRE